MDIGTIYKNYPSQRDNLLLAGWVSSDKVQRVVTANTTLFTVDDYPCIQILPEIIIYKNPRTVSRKVGEHLYNEIQKQNC